MSEELQAPTVIESESYDLAIIHLEDLTSVSYSPPRGMILKFAPEIVLWATLSAAQERARTGDWNRMLEDVVNESWER